MEAGLLFVPMDSIAFKVAPTLDAVVAGISYANHYDGERAAKATEIDKNDLVPKASKAIIIGETKREIVSSNRAFLGHLRANPSLANAVEQRPWRKDAQMLDFGQIIMNNYEVHQISGVLFFAVCEPREVVKLISEAGHLGTNRKNFGQITGEVQWQSLPGQSDNPLFGIVGNGKLLRPVPMSRKFGVEPDEVRFGLWRNPYNQSVARQIGILPERVGYPGNLAAMDVYEALDKYQ